MVTILNPADNDVHLQYFLYVQCLFCIHATSPVAETLRAVCAAADRFVAQSHL